MKRKRIPIAEGETIGQLTALSFVDVDTGGNVRWRFRCACGREVIWRVSTARYNARKLGWCSCGYCYRAAGGWEAIRDTLTAK
jgi:hypothetical protein